MLPVDPALVSALPGIQTLSENSHDLRQIRNVSLARPGIVKNFAGATRQRVKSLHLDACFLANEKVRRAKNRMGQLMQSRGEAIVGRDILATTDLWPARRSRELERIWQPLNIQNRGKQIDVIEHPTQSNALNVARLLRQLHD